MANAILTPTQVTREALRILHQKLNFVGSINRQYDDSFAKSGAKIGDQLKIRLPNQYTVRTGKVIDVQDTDEESVTLQVATQKGVDMQFSSQDLTLSLDDFSSRILEPAMAVLAANVEADACSMYMDVFQTHYLSGAATIGGVLAAGKMLTDSLTPLSGRSANLNTQDTVDLVDGLKGLFQDSTQVARQYREGQMGRAAGFDFMENTLWPRHLRGAAASYQVNGANQTGATLTVETGTGSVNRGDVFTIANVFSVHPETKVSTGVLQQFVITESATGNSTSLKISPSIIDSGARQNVNASPANDAPITFVGTASKSFGTSLLYHKDAFTFATADLVMPKGVDFAAREVYDGVSMRVVRAYDINNDNFPCRIDLLYGYKTLRAQLAARLATKQEA